MLVSASGMLRTAALVAATLALTDVAQASEPPAFPWQCWRTGEGPWPNAQGCIPAVSGVPQLTPMVVYWDTAPQAVAT